MTPEQIALVQSSFARLPPDADAVAAAFYRRLFEIDPSVIPMFHSDLTQQGARMMRVLGAVVTRLHELDELLDSVRALGIRHVRYGVEARHYACVGTALLDTLRAGLGDAFDDRTRAAWAAAYGVLAGVMSEAAEAAAPTRPRAEAA